MAGASSNSNQFKKVAVSERKKLLKELQSREVSVFLKSGSKVTFFTSDLKADDKVLWLRYTVSSVGAEIVGEVLLNFASEEERYFMATEVLVQGNQIGVFFDRDLFLLQRRESNRVQIPIEYPATFNILGLNGRPVFIEMRVDDFSAGGMRLVETRDPINFKMTDIVKGNLKLGTRAPMEFECEVRFVGSQTKNESEEVKVAGVEFQKIDTVMEGRLMSIVFALQQEVLKMKGPG